MTEELADAQTIVACASATGGIDAVIRLSGPQARSIAATAQIPTGAAWMITSGYWPLAGGRCPCRTVVARAPRSFTGYDVVEITLPGSAALMELALAALHAAGAVPASPGAFTRQALATGRLTLDRAEAILALTHAPSAAAAQQALARLRATLSDELQGIRKRLLHVRALIEAGLDFVEESDVRAYDPPALRAELVTMYTQLTRWLRVAHNERSEPLVCLIGPANAGKSALFNALTQGQALVSPQAGTTRDWLDGIWHINGRAIRLVDTAGWFSSQDSRDIDSIHRGQSFIDAAAVVLACSAPDAALAADTPLPPHHVRIATKADLGQPDPLAQVTVSTHTGAGLADLANLVSERISGIGGSEARQQRLLAQTLTIMEPLCDNLPGDELLAEDLRQCADLLGDLLGVTTTDDVLDAIFSQFCIGK